MKIRKAQISDSDIIHKLSLQLGYTPDLSTVKQNVAHMIKHSDYELVVMTNVSGHLIGWMSLVIRYRIEDVSFLQVAALVIDENVRGRGAGRLLMDYAAEVAKIRHLTFVGLHSSKSRAGAHAFYEHIGYQKAKESFFFRKDMK